MTYGMTWGGDQKDQSQVAAFSWGEGIGDRSQASERMGSSGKNLARALALECDQLGGDLHFLF